MTPLRSSLLCVLSAAAACHGDAVTNSPVPSLAAINFVHAASDAVVADFRVVDIVSNAGLFGAPFRGMNQYPVGIEAGTRHIKVFYDTTDVVLAKTVLLDTTYAFTADLGQYDDDTFDMVFSGQSIEHVHESDADLLLKGAFRILRPGGLLCLDTPNARVCRLHTGAAVRLTAPRRDGWDR